jgi:hypothetical protein
VSSWHSACVDCLEVNVLIGSGLNVQVAAAAAAAIFLVSGV